MKYYLISDNIDTGLGMRLAGVEGIVVHEAEEVLRALDGAIDNSEIGIILITEKLARLCRQTIYRYKLERRQPLIVEIPDRHGSETFSETISRYVKDAIGITI